MKKQCLVIGLGTYGMNVAKKLEDSNIDVLAIDKNDVELIHERHPGYRRLSGIADDQRIRQPYQHHQQLLQKQGNDHRAQALV